MRIHRIAAAVEYNDPTRFERDFKKTSRSPLQHRVEYVSSTVKDRPALEKKSKNG
jgi:transcriptional regulator GlxA family with amidase domain